MINRKLGWFMINELIDSETLTMVHKSINNQAPICLTEMLAMLSASWTRELRNIKAEVCAEPIFRKLACWNQGSCKADHKVVSKRRKTTRRTNIR